MNIICLKWLVKNIIFLVFTMIGADLLANDTKIEKLERDIPNAGHDTVTARLMNELAWEVRFSDPLKAEQLANKAMTLAKRHNLDIEVSRSYRVKAHAVLRLNDYYKSVVLYDSAISYAHLAQNNLQVALCLNNKAGVYGDLGDFDKAIEIYSKGLAVAKRLNNAHLMGIFYNNLADAYQNTGRNTILVQNYYNLALQNSINSKNWAAAGLNSSNLAKELSANKKLREARTELRRTIELLNKTPRGTYLYASTLKEMASVYDDLGDYNLAGDFALQAYKTLDSLKMPVNILRPLEVMTSVAIKAEKLGNAEKYANELLQLAIKTHSKIYIKEGYKFLGLISRKKGDYKTACRYSDLYKSWSDSVFQMERERNISKIELDAQLAKNDLEVKHGLELKKRENEKLLEDNMALKVVLIISTILLLILILLGFWLNKSIHNTKSLNAALALKNQTVEKQAQEKDILIQEIHHRVKNNLTMLQGLFHLQSRSESNTAVKQTLMESQSRILSMALVHQHLYENDSEGSLKLVRFIDNLLHDIADTFTDGNQRNVSLHVEGDDAEVGVKTAIPLGLILNELITNSLKYAFQNIAAGSIHITVQSVEGRLNISYMDNGPGLDDNDFASNNGLGFKIMQLLSRQLKTEIVHTKSGKHSVFNIQVEI